MAGIEENDREAVRRLAELLLPDAHRIAVRGSGRMQELLPAYARVPRDQLIPVLQTNTRHLLEAIRDPDGDPTDAQEHFRTSGTVRARQGITSDEMLNGWRIGLEVVREEAHRMAELHGIGKEPLLEFVVASLRWGDVGMRMSASTHHEAEIRELGRLVNQEASLRRVATMVAQDSTPKEVFAQVAEEVGRLVGAEAACVVQYAADGAIRVAGTWGAAGREDDPALHLGESADRLIAEIRESGLPAETPGDGDAGSAPGSAVGAPVVVDGLLWGAIIAAATASSLEADAADKIAQFTDLVASAISNVQARADLAASRARLVAAADDERRRVVRDLHDGAQQRLLYTIMTLKLARRALEGGNGEATELLGEAIANAQTATDELRELAHGILPSVLSDGGLRAGVDALASRVPIPVRVEVEVDRLPRPVEATGYFTVAEALTNVVKHARASTATVRASVADGVLAIEIVDDGVGGARADGAGLVGLRDRAATLDGRLDVETTAEGGTRVLALIPVEAGSLDAPVPSAG